MLSRSLKVAAALATKSVAKGDASKQHFKDTLKTLRMSWINLCVDRFALWGMALACDPIGQSDQGLYC